MRRPSTRLPLIPSDATKSSCRSAPLALKRESVRCQCDDLGEVFSLREAKKNQLVKFIRRMHGAPPPV